MAGRRLARELRALSRIGRVDILHRHARISGPRNEEVDGRDRACKCRAAYVRREPSRFCHRLCWWHVQDAGDSRGGAHLCHARHYRSQSNIRCVRMSLRARFYTLFITRRPKITRGRRWLWLAPARLVSPYLSALNAPSLSPNDRSRYFQGPR